MSNAGVALFNIAKESVVRVNIKIGDHVSPIGTAFLYKQIIDDIGKKSRLYFFTNLHSCVFRSLWTPFPKNKWTGVFS